MEHIFPWFSDGNSSCARSILCQAVHAAGDVGRAFHSAARSARHWWTIEDVRLSSLPGLCIGIFYGICRWFLGFENGHVAQICYEKWVFLGDLPSNNRDFMGFSWRWFIRLPENWISWVIFMEESMGWWSNMINGCSSGLKHGWLGNLAQMGISFPLTGGYLAKTEHSVDCCGEKSSLEIMISTPKSRGLKSYSGNGRIHLDSL